MNYESNGELIAKINGTKKKLHVSCDNCDDTTHKELKLPLGQSFQLTVNPDKERQILYICGASGSGKSFFAKQYCDEYTRHYKKNPIYLFSSLPADDSVDCIKNLKRVNIRDIEFISEDLDIDDFKDSLIIFDDTDCISDKQIKNKIQSIAEMCLETGRHKSISIIFTSHTACNGHQTKKILNESHSITLFLRSLGGKALKYLLESYFGLDKKQIKKIKSMKGDGRALTITKTFPVVAFSEKRAILLHDEDD